MTTINFQMRSSHVTSDELQGLASEADDMHYRLSRVRIRAEKTGLLDTGNLRQAEALMRLSQAAADLAYSIVLGERAKQDRRDIFIPPTSTIP